MVLRQYLTTMENATYGKYIIPIILAHALGQNH